MHGEETNPVVAELVARGLLDEATLADISARAARDNISLLKALVLERAVTEGQIYQVVAEAAGLPFVEPYEISEDPAAVALLPSDWARKLNALPFDFDGQRVVVAVSDPGNITTMDDLRQLTKREPVIVLSPPEALARRIEQIYRTDGEIDEITGEFATDDTSDDDIGEAEEAPVVRYVNLLLNQAIADRASDIHIEPTDRDTWVRFRIDGVLHEQMRSPRNIVTPVVSRIKILANMDISEHRIPQDGRITVRVHGRKVDLRVATLPTVHGEKVVMRILDNASAPTTLEDVGLSDHHLRLYDEQFHRPYGMILVTGPTGSGKTTTLYATLNALKRPEVNILTVEDPVEYRTSGVSQIQINPKAGLTFATALRSILRADPDILLVGEIRDKETAKISVESALTGHLVMTTLHTNDSTSAVTRLMEMGIEPFLVGSALNVVVAQRLLRRLCARCSEPYQPTREELEAAGFPCPEGEPLPELRRHRGCPHCSRTGYRGRLAIHEMLVVDDRIERMANSGAHTDQIREYAVNEAGMVTMRQDGFQKALAGVTTLEEVLRVSA